jgi:hypothetical protein
MKILMIMPMIALAITVSAAASVQAQVPLAPLWPNDDGMRWDYDMHLTDLIGDIDMDLDAFLALEGTTMTPGGEAQNLFSAHQDPFPGLTRSEPALPPILLMVWRARPDLRPAIEARYGGKDIIHPWFPNFLHGGYFLKSAENIQMWQDTWLHPTWTYLEVPVTTGHSFTHQLVPEFADDIFLHGTVADTDAAVSTPAGDFTGAVKMDYLIDLGISKVVNEQGELIGTIHGEYTGSVHYVPDVGPVNLFEEHMPIVWADCPGGCPPEIEDNIGVVTTTITMGLKALPVGVQHGSWGMVKSLYR